MGLILPRALAEDPQLFVLCTEMLIPSESRLASECPLKAMEPFRLVDLACSGPGSYCGRAEGALP